NHGAGLVSLDRSSREPELRGELRLRQAGFLACLRDAIADSVRHAATATFGLERDDRDPDAVAVAILERRGSEMDDDPAPVAGRERDVSVPRLAGGCVGQHVAEAIRLACGLCQRKDAAPDDLWGRPAEEAPCAGVP